MVPCSICTVFFDGCHSAGVFGNPEFPAYRGNRYVYGGLDIAAVVRFHDRTTAGSEAGSLGKPQIFEIRLLGRRCTGMAAGDSRFLADKLIEQLVTK